MTKLKINMLGCALTNFNANPANTSHLTGALNLFGSLYLIPFKIEWDHQSERYSIRASKLRKVISGGIHIINILLLANCAYRRCFSESQASGFMSIVSHVDFMTNVAFNLTMLQFLWRSQGSLEIFLNTKSNKAARAPKFQVLISISLYLLEFGLDIYSTGLYCSKCISIFPPASVSSLLCKPSEVNLISGIAEWFLMVILAAASLFMYISEGLCCSVTLNMWKICKQFEKDLNIDLSFHEGMDIVKEHQLAFHTVNQCFSSLLLMQIVTSFLYFSQAPIVLHFDASYYYKKGVMIAYIVEAAVVWGLAGECHALTRRTIKNWIQHKQEKANKHTPIHEQFQLAALSQDLDSDPIALSCGFSNMTYRFDASLLGLLISYNIIIFQMADQGKALSIRTSGNMTLLPTPSF